MNAERKKEYRATMSDYAKKKYREYCRRRYENLTPEQKAEMSAKRREYYQENKERIKKYQLDKYHKLKEGNNGVL